jgi:hypothetical protein
MCNGGCSGDQSWFQSCRRRWWSSDVQLSNRWLPHWTSKKREGHIIVQFTSIVGTIKSACFIQSPAANPSWYAISFSRLPTPLARKSPFLRRRGVQSWKFVVKEGFQRDPQGSWSWILVRGSRRSSGKSWCWCWWGSFFLALVYIFFIVGFIDLWILAFTITQGVQPCERFLVDLSEFDCGPITWVGWSCFTILRGENFGSTPEIIQLSYIIYPCRACSVPLADLDHVDKGLCRVGEFIHIIVEFVYSSGLELTSIEKILTARTWHTHLSWTNTGLNLKKLTPSTLAWSCFATSIYHLSGSTIYSRSRTRDGYSSCQNKFICSLRWLTEFLGPFSQSTRFPTFGSSESSITWSIGRNVSRRHVRNVS